MDWTPQLMPARSAATAIALVTAAAWASLGLGLGPATGSAVVGLAAAAALALVVLPARSRGQADARVQAATAAAWEAAHGTPPPSAEQTEEPSARLIGLLASVADTSRATRAELDGSRRLLAAVLDALDGPVMVVTSDGVTSRANAAARAFAGDRDIEGRRLEDVFTSGEVIEAHQRAASGERAEVQIRVPARVGGTGPRLWDATATPIGDGMVVLELRDVTALATATSLKTDFVANASHELRTPLASIKAAIETLQDAGPDDAAMSARLLRMIAENAQRLEELTRDLLDLSRLESPDAAVEMRPVRASDLAADLASTFEGVCAERQLTLAFELSPEVERLRTDPRLLGLILRNLIENSTKFAYEGTTVRVAAEPTGAEGVRWRVIDEGIGIPLGQQQRVFERFYQVDMSRAGGQERRGTGLGLAIVKHAVRALRGTIRVDSVWKQGTTMTVDLPRCVEREVGRPGE